MIEQFSIRPYQKTDWPHVFEMLTQTMDFHMSIQDPVRFKTYTKKLLINFLRGITMKHRSGKGRLLVATNEHKQLVGFIYGHVDSYDKELAKSSVVSGTIDELYVATAARKKGLAQLLMQKMEAYLISKNCVLIRLKDVHAPNKPAINLYSKLHYVPRVIEYAKRVG